ncbi:hypothetical protein [Enterobacter ludwigii]|nr:hypothetical protein [Enterobacter ludwigii]
MEIKNTGVNDSKAPEDVSNESVDSDKNIAQKALLFVLEWVVLLFL